MVSIGTNRRTRKWPRGIRPGASTAGVGTARILLREVGELPIDVRSRHGRDAGRQLDPGPLGGGHPVDVLVAQLEPAHRVQELLLLLAGGAWAAYSAVGGTDSDRAPGEEAALKEIPPDVFKPTVKTPYETATRVTEAVGDCASIAGAAMAEAMKGRECIAPYRGGVYLSEDRSAIEA